MGYDKKFFVEVVSFSTAGPYDDPSDEPYEGYCDIVIDISSVGPAYYSYEGKGRYCHRVENFRNIDWDKIKEGKELHLIMLRYSDGDTFGNTEGYFKPLYISNDEGDALTWKQKNYNEYKRIHDNNYFGKFIDLEYYKVILKK